MAIDLALLWAFLIAFAVLAYVLLDGFDLGVGILYPVLGGETQRGTAMNSIAPVWDGNETWLILGGGGLFATFPLAYSIVMPALYPPIMAMLFGLIFRGVAFEYRWKTEGWVKRLWDTGFFGGSVIAALSQGIALGALVQGIDVDGRAYGGGWWDWLTPFSLLTGVAVTVGYALLGATWLIMKTEGQISDIARRMAFPAALLTLLAIGGVSLWTPFLDTIYLDRWFSWPTVALASPIPILVLVVTGVLLVGLRRGWEYWPFFAACGLFVLSFIGLGISFYPMIVPPALTIQEAAAPDSSLVFLLVGSLFLLPLILGYTAYSYYVFRGKVREDEGYH